MGPEVGPCAYARSATNGAQQTDDLMDRLETTVRDHVLGLIPADSSGELAAMPLRALVSVYWRWRERIPAAQPRTVHRSRELAASPGATQHAADLAELQRKMTAGEDLTPHLSERVEVAYISDANRPNVDRRMRDADRDDIEVVIWAVKLWPSSTTST